MCLAVPGKILSTESGNPLERTGEVSFDGVVKRISLIFVLEAKVDDYVVVHAGFAISIIDESEALKTIDYLREINLLTDSTESIE